MVFNHWHIWDAKTSSPSLPCMTFHRLLVQKIVRLLTLYLHHETCTTHTSLQLLRSRTINTFRWMHAYLNTNNRHTNGSPFLICNTQIEHQLSRDESARTSRQNARALANNANGCVATETRRLEDAFRRINPVLNSAYAWRQNALKGYSILCVLQYWCGDMREIDDGRGAERDRTDRVDRSRRSDTDRDRVHRPRLGK